jgi:hypothetical protein
VVRIIVLLLFMLLLLPLRGFTGSPLRSAYKHQEAIVQAGSKISRGFGTCVVLHLDPTAAYTAWALVAVAVEVVVEFLHFVRISGTWHPQWAPLGARACATGNLGRPRCPYKVYSRPFGNTLRGSSGCLGPSFGPTAPGLG